LRQGQFTGLGLLRELEVQAEVPGVEEALDVLDEPTLGVSGDAPRPEE
jgi:hypothetical protein